MLRRLLDILAALILGVVSIPIMSVAALIVWLADPGPVFVVERRYGLSGRSLRVWKLRTQYLDSAAILARYLDLNPEERRAWERQGMLDDDPRVIPWIGDVLRRNRLDELPMLGNVLRGDLALIGRRALLPAELECLSAEAYRAVSALRPGLFDVRAAVRYPWRTLRLSAPIKS